MTPEQHKAIADYESAMNSEIPNMLADVRRRRNWADDARLRPLCPQGDKAMAAKMRAKVVVDHVTRHVNAEQLQMNAVYGGSTNAEDNTFSEATPSASFSMTITNKSLFGQFNPGDKFYVEFTPAE